jgi:hypothetical protein
VAYDEGLAQRVREIAGDTQGFAEKKMFGGLCFLVRGNMALGVTGEELMIRVGPSGWEAALERPHAREMDFTGRSLKGFVYVEPAGLEDDEELRSWIERGLGFAGSLPPKT